MTMQAFFSATKRPIVRLCFLLSVVLALMATAQAEDFIAVHGDVREREVIALLQAVSSRIDSQPGLPRLRCSSPIRVDSQRQYGQFQMLILPATLKLPGWLLQAEYWRLQFWCGWQQQSTQRYQAVQNVRRRWPNLPVLDTPGSTVTSSAISFLSSLQTTQLLALRDHQAALIAHWQAAGDGRLYVHLQPDRLPQLLASAGLRKAALAPELRFAQLGNRSAN